MLTVIPIPIKGGKKIELSAMLDYSHDRNLDHARNVAKRLGWEIIGTEPDSITAYAPEPPVLDQILDVFFFRDGSRTHFQLTVDKTSYSKSKVSLVVLVAPAKPFTEDKTAAVLALILNAFAQELKEKKRMGAVTWVHFNHAAFARDLENSVDERGQVQIPSDTSKYETRIRVD